MIEISPENKYRQIRIDDFHLYTYCKTTKTLNKITIKSLEK